MNAARAYGAPLVALRMVVAAAFLLLLFGVWSGNQDRNQRWQQLPAYKTTASWLREINGREPTFDEVTRLDSAHPGSPDLLSSLFLNPASLLGLTAELIAMILIGSINSKQKALLQGRAVA